MAGAVPGHHRTKTVEPIFGDDAGRHRHAGALPPSGLGTPLRQLATGAGGEFNEREMAVVRAAAARRRGGPEPNFEIVGSPLPPPARLPRGAHAREA